MKHCKTCKCCSKMDFHRYNEQVAKVWDLVDGCGGKGHVDGMCT